MSISTARLGTRLRALPRVARAIAAIVGFVATAIGIVFGLWPSLKPDPPQPIAAQRSATRRSTPA